MLRSICETSGNHSVLRRKRIRRVILKGMLKKNDNNCKEVKILEDFGFRKESLSSVDNLNTPSFKKELIDDSEACGITYLLNSKEEKLVLLSNEVNFSFYGNGVLKVYFGSINILGTTYLSFDETNMTYQFDFSEQYPLFRMDTVRNNKKYDTDRFEMLIETENKLKDLTKEHPVLKNLKENNFYTLLLFQNTSPNFKIIENPEKSYSIIIDNNFITNSYGKYMDYPVLLDKNNSFLVSGKRNSGKSAFTTYLLNKLYISHMKGDRELYLIDCDAGQPLLTEPFCISLIKINQPILTNYPNKSMRNNVTILKHFVEENSQINFWQSYLFLINSLVGYFRLNLNYSKRNYLVINTNGHTDGLGYTVNTKLSELIKPNIIFFLKNQFSGRGEKARRLESFYYERFPKNTLIINNNFNLDEKKTTYLKSINRMLSLYNNLIGDKFSFQKMDFILPGLLDIIHDKNLHRGNLIEIDFEKINFSFDGFQPKSELEILLAINLKLCVFLDIDKFSQNSKLNESVILFSDLRVLDKNLIVEKNFIAFGFVVNIDIINKKLIILSNALNRFFECSSDENRKLILFRNTHIDNCLGSHNKHDSENLFEKLVGNLEFFDENKNNIENKYDISYYLRNVIK